MRYRLRRGGKGSLQPWRSERDDEREVKKEREKKKNRRLRSGCVKEKVNTKKKDELHHLPTSSLSLPSWHILSAALPHS